MENISAQPLSALCPPRVENKGSDPIPRFPHGPLAVPQFRTYLPPPNSGFIGAGSMVDAVGMLTGLNGGDKVVTTYSSHILPCTASSSSAVMRFPEVK